MKKDAEKEKKKITSRQVVAMGGVILLVMLYITTLVVAIVDHSSSGRMFGMCLFATIAVPILIWIYTWMYGKLTGRHTFADMEVKEYEQLPADPALEIPSAQNEEA